MRVGTNGLTFLLVYTIVCKIFSPLVHCCILYFKSGLLSCIYNFITMNLNLTSFLVRDTKTSFPHVDRGSMHAVERHNDLFSWKKYNKYTHMSTLYEYRCKDVIEIGNKLLMQKIQCFGRWTPLFHVSNE
jgi:hypothetical protein